MVTSGLRLTTGRLALRLTADDLDFLAGLHGDPEVAGHLGGTRDRAFPHPAYAAAGPMTWFERDREDWLAEQRDAPE